MRKRLVAGVTPAALTSAPVVAATPPADAPPASRSLAGRWYRGDRSVLDIRTGDGRQLEWDWELLTDRVTMRALGTGSASDRLILPHPRGPNPARDVHQREGPVPGRGVQAGPPLTRSIC